MIRDGYNAGIKSMKKVMFLLAVGVMCLTACAQKKKDGERGPRQGGHMVINKDSDSVFAALKQETLGKFKQLTYNDKQTGKTMEDGSAHARVWCLGVRFK